MFLIRYMLSELSWWPSSCQLKLPYTVLYSIRLRWKDHLDTRKIRQELTMKSLYRGKIIEKNSANMIIYTSSRRSDRGCMAKCSYPWLEFSRLILVGISTVLTHEDNWYTNSCGQDLWHEMAATLLGHLFRCTWTTICITLDQLWFANLVAFYFHCRFFCSKNPPTEWPANEAFSKNVWTM